MQGAVLSAPASNIEQRSLVAVEDQKDSAVIPPKSCTEERDWCLKLVWEENPEHTRYTVVINHGAVEAEYDLPDDLTEIGNVTFNFWQNPVAFQTIDNADALLFGIIGNASEGYSGGGASAHMMQLYRAEVGKGNSLIVTPLEDIVPFGGSALIKACFSEEDMKLRRDMCHDDYMLSVTIKPTGAMQNGLPELLYVSQATVTPGFASRWEDNSDKARLKRMKPKDFKTRVDDRCSYTVKMRADPDRQRYALNFRDCSEFTATME